MPRINWHGNDGCCFPNPGKIKRVRCGVCNSLMNVTRNVLGPTSLAEAMAQKKHEHDSFFCPNYKEDWHNKIRRLKSDVYMAEIKHVADFKRKKKAARKEIQKILKTHMAR